VSSPYRLKLKVSPSRSIPSESLLAERVKERRNIGVLYFQDCGNVIAQKAVYLSRNVRGKKGLGLDVSNSLTPSLVIQRLSPPPTPMDVDEPADGVQVKKAPAAKDKSRYSTEAFSNFDRDEAFKAIRNGESRQRCL